MNTPIASWPGAPADDGQAVWRIVWHTGPDSGCTMNLSTGVHVVGRGDTGIGLSDPLLEPHHLRLEVRDDGTIDVLQLTGRTPLQVNGSPRRGTARIRHHAWVTCGAGLLEISHLTTATATATGHPTLTVHDGVVVRRPRVVQHWSATPAPHPGERHNTGTGGIIGGVAASLVLAVVTGNPVALLVGVSAGIATKLATSWRYRRALHRHRRSLAGVAESYRLHLLEHEATLVDAIAALTHRDARIWSRRPSDGDAYRVALGLGSAAVPIDVPMHSATTLATTPTAAPSGSHPVVDGVPVAVDLGPGCRLAIGGPHDHTVALALLTQLVTWCGPADLSVVILSERPQRWSAFGGLQHVRLLDDVDLPTVVEDADRHHQHLLFVTDRPSTLAVRTSALRRVLGEQHGLVTLVAEQPTPRVCTAVLRTHRNGTATWASDTGRTATSTIRWAGVTDQRAGAALAVLQKVHDPEDATAADAALATEVHLRDLEWELDPGSIASRWQQAGADATPRALLGMAGDGVVEVDLARDGPHGLLAGTTGSGKSELLRTLVLGFAVHAPADRVAMVLVDYKGGAAFDTVRDLPHVVGVVTDLDDGLADRVLRSLHAELRRRERLLREHTASDLIALRQSAPDVLLPRLVVVVDEFANLASEQPSFLHALVGIAQRGRSLGMHLLLATQRPHGAVSDDIRANTSLRIALRLQDSAESLDVIGVPDAAALARRTPGRAIVRLGGDEPVLFQTAVCTDPATIVRAVCAAHQQGRHADPPPPWCPPLPELLLADDTPADAIGLVDLPDEQRVEPLRWNPDDGGVVVAGAARSGATTALCLLATQALAHGRRVYVLDGRHGTRSAVLLDMLLAHPGCGGVVRPHEHDALWRLLHHASSDPCVLVVDALDHVRRALDDTSTLREAATLEQLLTSPGVTLIAGVTHVEALPPRLLAATPHRWQLQGAGRVVLNNGAVGQLVADPHTPAAVDDAVPAPSTAPIPADLRLADLPTACAIGVEVPSGAPVILDVRPGDHLLVLGGARTGRTTTLHTLGLWWHTAHPDAAVRVVDDADLVDDADGSIAAAIAAGTTVIAAARPDALRTQYGHWTGLLRRSRTGLVAVGGSELDGDLLGVVLPRTAAARARPGLMWLVQSGTATLVQVARQ